ncbi:hypothetical protein PMZ80_006504 [Knufia obscura]|uniref:Heterokaryon incompatibility domain-containing protein n=2 Tax=Knufia TaxID=430999 RepID=A0AAN8I7J3_9EURO|nr:hypothetical protein PMZ80_006504 [Knufia obscura]KAK5953346.1 hypothetical protein OHC33_005290 [Knufia fluminis]
MTDSMGAIETSQYEKVYVGIEPQQISTFENGRTSADAYHDKKVLLRVVIYLDLRDIGKDFHYFLNLQHSEEVPPSLTKLLSQTQGLIWPSHAPYTARIRPQVADMQLLGQWKDKCISQHAITCEQAGAHTIPTIRLIDVQDKCIVVLPGNISWTALSYCWGGPQRHSLLKSRLKQYQQPGALTEDMLPPVIADAMIVTAALGERYLWVDSMCIVQDDELDKATFLTIMDEIYSHAIVTIVNAATANANAPEGLPGIRSSSPRRIQEPLNINGAWLTEALDPGHGSFSGYLDKCAWSARGWTFQEGLLSRRCLVFTSDQIYWQCRKSSWCEGSFWERDDELQIYRHCFADNLLTSISEAGNKSWITVYLAILQKYLSRAFTSEADRLHALSGILRALEDVTAEEFFWGIPRSKLEHGIAFTPQEPAARRDSTHTFINAQGQLISSPFPSWSWVGWIGNIGMVSLHPSITIGTLGLQFYSFDERGILTRADTPSPPDKTVYDGLQQQIRYPPAATHNWMDKSRQVIDTADVPATVVARRNIMPSLLCFWTSVATLKIERRGWDNYHNEPRVIMSQDEVEFAGLWGRYKDLDPPDHGLFIVVGAAKLRMSHGGDLTLKLLLVDRDNDLVCRRKHLITEVKERDWERLRNKKWEMVFLA